MKQIFELSDGPASLVRWAPDSRRVAFNGRAIEVWDVIKKEKLAHISIPARGWPPLAWSPNGRCLSVGDTMTGSVTIYDASTAEPISKHVFTGHSMHLDWLGDGLIRRISDKTQFWDVPLDASGNPRKEPVREAVLGEEEYIPVTLDECMKQLDAVLSKESKTEIMKKTEFDMIGYHLGLGMWIRNCWGLRSGSNLYKYFSDNGIREPESASNLILRGYWCHLHGHPVVLDALVKEQEEDFRKIPRKP